MTRNSWTLAFLALVFAVALLLLFLEPMPGDGDDAGGAAAGQATPGGAAGAWEGADGEGLDPGIGAVERVPEAGTVEDDAALAAGPGTMTVTVVADASGEPVAGASVYVLDAPDRERAELLERFESELDVEDFLRETGVALRTDADGKARMPRPRGWVVGCAVKGEDFAFGMIGMEQPAAAFELRLRKDVTLRLRVVDERGEPVAGVPVELQVRSRNWSQGGIRRVSDAAGRASFPHAQVRITGAPARSSLWLAAALPLAPMAELQLDPLAADLEAEKTLTLPATGAVRVQLLDYDGREFTRPVEVHLQSYDAEAGAPRGFRPHAARGHVVAESDSQGVAVFERVGVGLDLVAGAVLDGSDDWFTAVGRGPERPGDRALLQLRQDRLRPELVFRVLDPDGEPLRRVTLRCIERSVDHRDRPSDRSRTRSTDEDGLLRYTPRSGPLGTLQSRELELRYRSERGAPEWRGVLDLSHDIADGSHAMGDVRLEAPRLLAAGVVTAPDGSSVDGASVQLYVEREDSRPGRVRWRRDNGADTRSSEDGSFEVYGAPSGRAMELRAAHPDYLQGTTQAIVGFEEHRIVLDAGRRVEGRVVVDDGTVMDHLAVSWYPGSAQRDEGRSWVRGSRRIGVEPDGSFSFGAMDGGTGWLEVSDRRNSLTLATVENVEPWPQGAVADGRLDPIDLRGQVRPLKLMFTDMAGEPATGVRFSVSVPGSEEAWWNVVRERDGSAEILAPPGGVDVYVRSTGFREQRIPGVTGDRTIRLEAAIPLRFQLRPSALAAEFDLELRTRSVGDGPSIEPGTLRFGPDGLAEASAPRGGPLHLYLRVRYRSDDGRTQSRYVNFGALGRRLEVQVQDSSGAQTITVDVARSDIEEATRGR